LNNETQQNDGRGGAREIVLDARGLRKEYAGAAGRRALALDGVSLVLRSGETVGCIGESGGGKSTLARVLARFTEPDSGELWLRDASSLRGGGAPAAFHGLAGDAFRAARRRIQLVFQDPERALDPKQTIGAAVEEALEARGAPVAERARAAESWLSRVGLPAVAARKRPRALSGGERQRVAIARALAAEPDVLILDEAFSALDAASRRDVRALIRTQQSERGFAILWISHDVEEALASCDRIVVLYLGRVVEEAPSHALARGEARHAYTQLLLSADGIAARPAM
jgi:peptide/nickel transport system ATP-binding protein